MEKLQLPDDIHDWIEKQIRPLGLSLNQPESLSSAVLELSTHFQNSDAQTPWGSPHLKAAYLAYFYPLNFIRSLKVISEANYWGLFRNTSYLTDFGCGPGSFSKALLLSPPKSLKKITGVDTSAEAGRFFLDTKRQGIDFTFAKNTQNLQRQGMIVLSYTLNELQEMPPWIFEYDSLVLIEPSTKQASESFQKARTLLLENNFNILAPCPHTQECPLKKSPKDWCHDRVYWQQPEWFQKLEKYLPIKNPSLTYSYLIASKTINNNSPYTRVVGDAQIEKGKTRWMICRNESREFASFLKRSGKAPLIYRGERIHFESNDKRGNELRFTNETFKRD